MAHLYRVILPVSEIEAATSFYSTVLGSPGTRISPGRHYFSSVRARSSRATTHRLTGTDTRPHPIQNPSTLPCPTSRGSSLHVTMPEHNSLKGALPTLGRSVRSQSDRGGRNPSRWAIPLATNCAS